MATANGTLFYRDSNGNTVLYNPQTESEAIVDFDTEVQDIIEDADEDFFGAPYGKNLIFAPLEEDFFTRPSLFTSAQTTITVPKGTAFVVNGRFYETTSDTEISLNSFVTAANRAGKDCYLYAVENSDPDSTEPVFVVSLNSTYPTGYDADTSRKLGGFHCLCVAAGTLATYSGCQAHPISGFAAGDVLPASIWDLWHRPIANPEGMLFDPNDNVWVDIYLPSVSGGKLVSVYGGTIADGASSPAFHWYKFATWFSKVGKRMPTQPEFMSLAVGSNVQTNIYGSADPGTTGGHKDTNNRRMISYLGVEDCCGVMWQWGFEAGGPNSGASWANAYDSNDDATMRGSHYNAPNADYCGAWWGVGTLAGPRSLPAKYSNPSITDNKLAPTGDPWGSGRGVSEPSMVYHNI